MNENTTKIFNKRLACDGALITVAKIDTSMSSSMCKTMMDDPKMMEMMDKMKHDKMNMNKMKGKDSQKPVDNSKHH
jgi:hypothetical protein